MSLSVKCPTCGKELLAPDELVGKLASCPHCQTQFPVTMNSTRTAGETRTTETRQPAAAPATPAGSIPVAKPLNLRAAPSMLQAASDAPAPLTPPPPPTTPPPPPAGDAHRGVKPAVAATPAGPQTPPAPGSPQPGHPAASLYPPGQSPRPAAVANTSVPAPAAKGAGRPPSSKPSREARPARFIAADASATRVELGHDGQLPVLQLEEVTRAEADGNNARAANPWLLVAALIFSFGMSAVLLFVDTDRAPAEKTTKRSARLEIEMHYTAPAAGPLLYRKLLREALQAYNKGDYATERQRYKDVLFLLHAENKDPLIGLTGQVKSANPPNDRHLEELLSTLVDR